MTTQTKFPFFRDTLPDIPLVETTFTQSIREDHEHLLFDDKGSGISEPQSRTFDASLKGPQKNDANVCPPYQSGLNASFMVPRKPVRARGGFQALNQEDEDEGNAIECSKAPRSSCGIPGKPVSAVKMWNPIWLSRGVLCGFIALFAAMVVALGLLFHFSKAHNGISTQITKNHYSWTYGPTAVLVLIYSLWWQVDYWCKVLTPWQEMRGKASVPDKSLLVDYISANPLSVAWNAWKNRHWVVLISLMSLALLKLITVFSTALLTLQPSSMVDNNFPLVLRTTFDASKLNGTYVLPINPGPILPFFGILDKGLPYPNGTSDSVAFRLPVPARTPPENATIIAETLGFFPKLKCETATLNWTLPPLSSSSYPVHDANFFELADPSLSYTITSSSCSTTQPGTFTDWLCNPEYETCPERDIVGMWLEIGSGLDDYRICNDSVNDTRVLINVFDVRYKQELPEGGFVSNKTASNASTKIAKSTSLLCQPSYSMRKALVSLDTASTAAKTRANVTGLPGDPEPQLPGFNNVNMSDFQGLLLSETPKISNFAFHTNAIKNAGTSDNSEYITFQLMMVANGHSSMEELLDPQKLAQSAAIVFEGIAAQTAQEYNLVDSNDPIMGKITYTENHLHVRVLSLVLMAVCLGLIVLAGLLILLLRPTDVVSRDPTTIGTIVTVLASSKSLEFSLQGHGHVRSADLHDSLLGHHYSTFSLHTALGLPCFVIERKQSEGFALKSSNESHARAHMKRWQPLSLRKPFFILQFCLPVFIIVVLEVLQRLSEHRDGIVSIGSQSNIQAVTNYIPAAIMLLVAAIFSSIAFNFKILAPYQDLAKGKSRAHRSILNCFIEKTTLLAMIDSIRKRYFAVFLSTVAAALASILTIVVSGLYVRGNVPVDVDAYVRRVDNFNLTWNNSVAGDNSAAVIVNLIEHTNVSYPQFTFDELAFPTVRLSDGNATLNILLSHAPDLPMKLQLPAIRARLSCSQVPPHSINYTTARLMNVSPITYQINMTARAALPAGCQHGGAAGNLPYIDIFQGFNNSNDGSGGPTTQTHFGTLQDLHLGPFSNLSFQSTGEDNANNQDDNPPGCPSLAIIYGNYRLNLTDTQNTTVLICSQVMDELLTTATFLLPDFRIDTTHPPVPDEGSAKAIIDGTGASKFRDYRIQNNLQTELSDFGALGAYPAIDTFFHQVIFGPQSIYKPDDLLGPANKDQLFAAVQRFYRRYMAQAVNSNMRQDITNASAADDLPTFSGTVTDPTPLRLKQDNASKVTLQILLAAIVACGVAAHLFAGNVRHLLYHNPCSIAGVASLLAGSEMVQRKIIPEGAEFMSNKELAKVFAGMTFSLGWWPSGDGTGERRFGIDIGMAERKNG